ncbi:hypothetical protein PHISCL_01193 [Aspergillus sclerotialis]|uniref:GH16 domain-containing protein n=1 Tax=Aspergillus sclerotialis TaxID=2070753 RepID=A0A3A2ZVW9_9EURO|nr:hypothetical protein PHISCL_01193 [Aspergillus sclerotialis]
MVQFSGLLAFYASLCIANADILQENSKDCDCYVTNGSSSAYFLYRRFFDFRNIPNSNGVYNLEPPNVTSSQDAGGELGQKGYLNSTVFADDWELQTWGRTPRPTTLLRMQNSKQSIYIQDNSKEDNSNATTFLTLRTYRNQQFSSTAEMLGLQRNVFHASIRIYARVHGVPGAVIGMFTYLNDSTESDIEILTRDQINHVRCSNQATIGPDGYTIPGASSDVTLPSPVVWTNWNIYCLDWLPGLSSWYVNESLVLNKTYGVPKLPSCLDINVWSDGSDWSGNMSVGSAAYLDIQWIEMVFNTSGPRHGYPTENNEKRNLERRSGPCKRVCSVDDVERIGIPVRSEAPTTVVVWSFSCCIWLLAAAIIWA